MSAGEDRKAVRARESYQGGRVCAGRLKGMRQLGLRATQLGNATVALR
jgi:hypothetical protein